MAFVSVSRAAAALGVGDDTVRRWVKAGRLPSSEDQLGRLLVEVPGDRGVRTPVGPGRGLVLDRRRGGADHDLDRQVTIGRGRGGLLQLGHVALLQPVPYQRARRGP